jgi:hypothetical protein
MIAVAGSRVGRGGGHEEAASHAFLIYWSLDMSLMAPAGNQGSCLTYLMGNHTIAERMYRHDQAAMLYVPLRTVICAAVDGPTRERCINPAGSTEPESRSDSIAWER